MLKPTVLEKIKPRYIIDEKGKKTSVILDVKIFKLMLDELEDLYDIAQAEEVLAKGEAEKGRTIDEIEKSLNKRG